MGPQYSMANSAFNKAGEIGTSVLGKATEIGTDACADTIIKNVNNLSKDKKKELQDKLNEQQVTQEFGSNKKKEKKTRSR